MVLWPIDDSVEEWILLTFPCHPKVSFTPETSTKRERKLSFFFHRMPDPCTAFGCNNKTGSRQSFRQNTFFFFIACSE